MNEKYLTLQHKVQDFKKIVFEERLTRSGLILVPEVGYEHLEEFRENPTNYEFIDLPNERIEALIKWEAHKYRLP